MYRLFLKSIFVAIILIQQSFAQTSISVFVHGTIVGFKTIVSKCSLTSNLMYIPDGITTIKDIAPDSVAHKLACEFCTQDSERFSYDHFYAFGWSGQLSFTHRENAAKELADKLVKLVSKYEKDYGVRPVIRMVTFSHGGNVVLRMSKYIPQNYVIELICIACPVQPASENLVHADCFSKIYVISSLSDIIQRIDPVNIFYNMIAYRATWLSKRFFDYDIAKIKQACVSVDGNYLGHFELFNMFNKHVPEVLRRLDLSEQTYGIKHLDVDIQDKKFRFFNGLNIFQVLLGKEI